MKWTLRVMMMTAMLSLLLVTVAGLGLSSFSNARFTADNLSAQILDQTALRVDEQLNELLFHANHQGDLNRELLESGQFTVEAFPALAAYWVKVMKIHPRLNRISFAIENSGEWYFVQRPPGGKLRVGELRRNPGTGKLDLSDYWPEDHPRKRFLFKPDQEDPRTQPWYRAAKASRRQTWSETYGIHSAEGAPGAPGVTCATPVFRGDGSLVGILSASFNLLELCQYLKDLPVGQSGYAFAVEVRADGTRRVIAHPNPLILLRKTEGDAQEFVPIEELADPHVAAFLNQVPATLAPTDVKDMEKMHFIHDDTHYVGGYRCLSTENTPNWLICILMPEEDVLGPVFQSNRRTIWIGLGVVILAVLCGLYLSRQVAHPLEVLTRQVAAIGQLHFDARPVPHSIIQEVDQLATAAEGMKTGLRSFRKYVPADLVRALMEAGQEACLGGENRVVTIYFCDIANFTSIAEELPPAQLVEHLGEYLRALSEDILATGGTVDKYIGDSIMAFWGAPRINPQHALSACTAAVRNQQTLDRLRARWQAEGKPLFHTRIGLHTGEVVVGNIGTEARLNYTVIGDAVNLASRLESLNKYYGTQILISESTYLEVKDAVAARPVDWVSVKGRTRAVLVYELLGLREEVDRTAGEVIDLSTRALAAYRCQDWGTALTLFDELLRLRPGDDPAQMLRTRCQGYQGHSLGENWDGAHRMDSK